jgi:hypothetical protein
MVSASEQAKRTWKAYKLIALYHYGGNPPKCACCGESRYEFLTFDHIHGGGLKHLKSINTRRLGVWLVKNNFPEGFRVLCMSCNFALGHFGFCPHQNPELSLNFNNINLTDDCYQKLMPEDCVGNPLKKEEGYIFRRREKCVNCGKYFIASGDISRIINNGKEILHFHSASCRNEYLFNRCGLCDGKLTEEEKHKKRRICNACSNAMKKLVKR